MSGGGGWEVGGTLYLLIILFGVAIATSLKILVIGLDKPGGLKKRLTNTGVNIRPIPLI